jgi:hypothetical protein
MLSTEEGGRHDLQALSGSLCFRGRPGPMAGSPSMGGGRRARSPGPKAPSAFKTALDPYRVHPPMRKAGYSKAKPCGSLRLPTGPWTSHVHFPGAGNQGLEPCKSWFWRPARALRVAHVWTWRDLNTLPPACKTGALPGELQAHSRSEEFCHPGLLFPKQALS